MILSQLLTNGNYSIATIAWIPNYLIVALDVLPWDLFRLYSTNILHNLVIV